MIKGITTSPGVVFIQFALASEFADVDLEFKLPPIPP